MLTTGAARVMALCKYGQSHPGDARPHLAVRLHHNECGRGGFVDGQFHRREVPTPARIAKARQTASTLSVLSQEDISAAPRIHRIPSRSTHRPCRPQFFLPPPRASRLPIVIESPDFLRLPKMQENHRANDGHHARHDIHQVAVAIVRPQILRSRKRNSHHQNRRQHFKSFRPAHHRAHQPETAQSPP